VQRSVHDALVDRVVSRATSIRPEERLGGYFVQPTVLTNVKPT
jgi:acyl-CoA reductase-like NAD-dependent aldehyde dehydrogenase